MSQNDMSIANGSGSTVRGDLNSALQALASQSSGASAPGTTYDGQTWFDTTNNILKIRDEANANWVNIASLVGTTWIPYSNGAVLGTLANQNAASIGADLVLSAKQVKHALATVASASNVNLGAAAGNSIELTGTTTITAFTIAAGSLYFVRYTGAGLTLTHNATTLVLPSGASISVATGDTFIVYGKASNEAAILGYQRASGAALVGALGAATQAELEAASSNTVAPTAGRQQFHPSAAKAWINGEMVGTHSANGYNVASITDLGVGQVRLNFTTAFSGTNYCVTGMARGLGGGDRAIINETASGTKSTTQFDAEVGFGYAATALDTAEYGMTFFGDQ